MNKWNTSLLQQAGVKRSRYRSLVFFIPVVIAYVLTTLLTPDQADVLTGIVGLIMIEFRARNENVGGFRHAKG